MRMVIVQDLDLVVGVDLYQMLIQILMLGHFALVPSLFEREYGLLGYVDIPYRVCI